MSQPPTLWIQQRLAGNTKQKMQFRPGELGGCGVYKFRLDILGASGSTAAEMQDAG
jgi:hypothetical protein